MLSGDNGILQRATDAKQNSERAEAKEQAQMDIIAYIADRTANHQDTSLDDEKVKAILSDKSYVKTANDTSFITAKGEYEIPYSELYTASKNTPSPSYGLSDDGLYFIGKPTDATNRTQDGNVEYADGYKFSQRHFFKGSFNSQDMYFCWDRDISEEDWNYIVSGNITSAFIGYVDIYYPDGEFYIQYSTDD